MDRFDPFVKYADVYGDIINWEKDPMNKPQNQNKYFFSDGKTYYEQICKMLRLMSVFKEAFNQIYSNEDEISEAWENFVNNLSASVVEGSEPDVTLTWTDDSVNFEFTMVPGVPGEQGVGITSISFNLDYTMTITLSDGNTYTSMSLKGETGPQGPQGETGSGLQILDVYATLADLQSVHPTGQPGDAYQVGSEGSYTLYIWSSSQSAWVPAGSLGTVSPSVSNPIMDGTASAGSLDQYSRGDHVHPTDTSRASKEELDALIKTSQALIDQSFTYRESPAIQDGLARIDNIKGNTLVWNQLASVVGEQTATVGLFNTNTHVYSGHKYLMTVEATPILSNTMYLSIYYNNGSNRQYGQVTGTSSGKYALFFNCDYTASGGSANVLDHFWFYAYNASSWKNLMLFDLTAMGLDSITDLAEFTSLFPLPYYEYNAGSLLSFNGNALKTVGFNQWDEEWENGYYNRNTGAKDGNTNTSYYRCTNFIRCFPNTYYYMKPPVLHASNNTYMMVLLYDGDKNYIQYKNPLTSNYVFNTENAQYMTFYMEVGTAGATYQNDVCINISNNRNGAYEPYTSNTASLPISTYFPTGMKSAGNAYDELTENKAITRIGMVDLGTLEWRRETGTAQGIPYVRFRDTIPGIKSSASGRNTEGLLCSDSQYFLSTGDSNYTYWKNTTGEVFFYNNAYDDSSSFKASMSGVYLLYEVASPTETAVDLDLDFMAYEDGTEQLLPVNGSVPSTSPIIADMTYLSIDDAMEYIIDKLANVPENTQQILDSLEDDVADLQTDVGALQTSVSGLQTSVGNINTNIGQLSSTVAGHTASISDMQSDITDLNTGLSDLEDTVTDNTSRISTLETDLASTDGQVQSLGSSVSTLSSTVSDQGTELGEIDSIIQDISNNPVIAALGTHELGFVAAYVDATLPANTGTRVTIPKPTIFPNNYTPLFIVGMSTGAYNVSICEIPPTFGNSDSVNCRVWNHGGQQTTQITVYILCMRQRQSQ